MSFLTKFRHRLYCTPTYSAAIDKNFVKIMTFSFAVKVKSMRTGRSFQYEDHLSCYGIPSYDRPVFIMKIPRVIMTVSL